MFIRRLHALLVLALFLASACRSNPVDLTRGCIQDFDPDKDYFPDKATLEYVTNFAFAVEYHKYYKVVTVHQSFEGGPPESYILVQCGAPSPKLAGALASATIVPVPISSMFSGSMTHHPLLVDLGRVEVLSGVSKASDAPGSNAPGWSSLGQPPL
jgi:iron complex transport system substrate-binding protein